MQSFSLNSPIDVDEFVETGVLGPFHRHMSLAELKGVASDLSVALQRFSEDQHFYYIGHILFDCTSDPTIRGCNISLYFPHPTTRHSQEYDFSTWPDPRFNWVLNKIKPGIEFSDAMRLYPEFEQRGAGQSTTDLKNNAANVMLLFDQVRSSGKSELILAQAQL